MSGLVLDSPKWGRLPVGSSLWGSQRAARGFNVELGATVSSPQSSPAYCFSPRTIAVLYSSPGGSGVCVITAAVAAAVAVAVAVSAVAAVDVESVGRSISKL